MSSLDFGVSVRFASRPEISAAARRELRLGVREFVRDLVSVPNAVGCDFQLFLNEAERDGGRGQEEEKDTGGM